MSVKIVVLSIGCAVLVLSVAAGPSVMTLPLMVISVAPDAVQSGRECDRGLQVSHSAAATPAVSWLLHVGTIHAMAALQALTNIHDVLSVV